MADGAIVKRDGAEGLVQAAEGKISWTNAKAAKPLLMGGIAGGLFVAVARWQAGKWFKTADGADAQGAKWKRGAVVAALGIAGAMLIKKWSVSAAIGFALVSVGYGALEVLDDPDGPFHVAARLTAWSNRSNAAANPGNGEQPAAGIGAGRQGGVKNWRADTSGTARRQ